MQTEGGGHDADGRNGGCCGDDGDEQQEAVVKQQVDMGTHRRQGDGDAGNAAVALKDGNWNAVHAAVHYSAAREERLLLSAHRFWLRSFPL